jgi:hypothetical protein
MTLTPLRFVRGSDIAVRGWVVDLFFAIRPLSFD